MGTLFQIEPMGLYSRPGFYMMWIEAIEKPGFV